jgi:hypothetical protein
MYKACSQLKAIQPLVPARGRGPVNLDAWVGDCDDGVRDPLGLSEDGEHGIGLTGDQIRYWGYPGATPRIEPRGFICRISYWKKFVSPELTSRETVLIHFLGR